MFSHFLKIEDSTQNIEEEGVLKKGGIAAFVMDLDNFHNQIHVELSKPELFVQIMCIKVLLEILFSLAVDADEYSFICCFDINFGFCLKNLFSFLS